GGDRIGMVEQAGQSRADVRMRGFATRSTVEQALQWIDSSISMLPRASEQVSLQQAAGRVLAEGVTSEIAVPGFRRAMMDGYAVQAADIQGASAWNPLRLKVSGTSFPGQGYPGKVEPGSAVRIMTGAPVPEGADSVLPVEVTEADGNGVHALADVPAGKHVGQPGEDVAEGQQLLPAGRCLRPQDLGVLSSTGQGVVSVWKRPRVRIVVTGNELLPAGTRPRGQQIADANGPMLRALAERDGGDVEFPGIVPDTQESIREALLSPAEIVLVSGGSSVGQEDWAPRVLAELGTLALHGLAMRPSSPAGMGLIGSRLVFLLPGNPVSCLCAYDFFAGRAIRLWGGRRAEWPYRMQRLPLAANLVSVVGRVDYARVRVEAGQVHPLAISGASVLTSTTRADGFVVVPADSEGMAAGGAVDVWLYDV
ncbi:MAG: Molybdopterin molybdenumtransferase, partial [Planctomycetota bacterium]